MQNVEQILSDLDNHNKKVKERNKKDFDDTIQSGAKNYFKQIFGIKNFGYSRQFSENYDKIKWR